MSYWVHLEDRTAEPWCSFGKDNWTPEYTGDEQCTSPCYPAFAVERHAEGGTYVMGGTDEAELNVTYNYGRHFHEAWEKAGGTFDGDGDGSLGSMLGEKRAGDTIELLARAVEILGTARGPDYWEATPGNAGVALEQLLGWARQHPDGIWRVS